MKKLLMDMTSQMKAGQEVMEAKLAANHETMTACQEAMKAELAVNQEAMKAELMASQEALRAGQGEVKDDVKSGQEEMKNELTSIMQEGQEKLKNELKEQMLEAHNVLREEVITEIENCKTKLEEQMKEEVGSVKEEIDRLEMRLKILEGNRSKSSGEFQPHRDQKQTLPSSVNDAHLPSDASGSQFQPVLKIGTYGGKASWGVFKQQFETIAEYNQWNDVSKAVHLTATLRGEAANVLETIPEGTNSKYQDLLKALELRFGEQNRKDFHMLQLKTRQQKPDETLQELASDIERLVLISYKDCPADAKEQIAVQHFIDAIRNSDIKKALRISECRNLRSTTTYALKIQAAQEADRMERRMVRQVEISDPEVNNSDFFQKLEKMLERALRLKPESPRKMKCWNCHEEGHLRNRCPQNNGERNSAPRQLNL